MAESKGFRRFLPTLLGALLSLSAFAAPPAVRLLSDPSAPPHEKDAILQLLREEGIETVNPDSFGGRWGKFEAGAFSIFKKLLNDSDGSEPIYLVVTSDRGINGGYVRLPNGIKLVMVSLGSLKSADDDSMVAHVLGHELEHPISQLQAKIDSKTGKIRDREPLLRSILSEMEDTQFQKGVENEVDLKSLVNRVHRNGYSVTQAIQFFDRIEAMYGNAYSLSHPLVVQRKTKLLEAATGLTRGRGEEIRVEPVNRSVTPEWKTFFQSAEYRKATAMEIRAALQSQPLPKLSEHFQALKSGAWNANPSSSPIERELLSRWSKLSRVIMDRPLSERIQLGEALAEQFARDYYAAKDRILGPDYRPKSALEAAHLLNLERRREFNPAAYDPAWHYDREAQLVRLYEDLDAERDALIQLEKSGDAKDYQFVAKREEAKKTIQELEERIRALMRLYRPTQQRRVESLARMNMDDLSTDWSESKYLGTRRNQELAERRKMSVRLADRHPDEELKAIEALAAHVEEIETLVPAELGRLDGPAYDLVRHVPKSKAANRRLQQLLLKEVPLSFARRLDSATEDQKNMMVRFFNYLNEAIPTLASARELHAFYSDPETAKALIRVIQEVNQQRARTGRREIELKSVPGRNNWKISDRAIEIPQDQYDALLGKESKKIDKILARLASKMALIERPLDVGRELERLFFEQTDVIFNELDGTSRDRIRDIAAAKYKQLIPGLKNPGELAEAVIDLHFNGIAYQLDGNQIFSRLQDASTALNALRSTRPEILQSTWRDDWNIVTSNNLFSYGARHVKADQGSQQEFFTRLNSSEGAMKFSLDSHLEPPNRYEKNLGLRRDYALWRVDHNPSHLDDLIQQLDRVTTQVGGKPKSPTPGDVHQFAGEVASRFKSDGAVNWNRVIKSGMTSSLHFGSDEFWKELSGGSERTWLRETLSFLDTLNQPGSAAQLKLSVSEWNGLKSSPFNSAFIDGPARQATPEELQKLTLAAFRSKELPWAERDRLFELFWKATGNRPDLRAPFTDDRWVKRLMFKENQLLLSKHLLGTRFPEILRPQYGRPLRDPNSTSNQIAKIRSSIERQFSEPSFTRNQILDWVEKGLLTTSKEHEAFAPLWVNQDNWVHIRGIALSDTLDVLAANLKNNGERIDLIKYMIGQAEQLPSSLEQTIGRISSRDERVEIQRLIKYLPSRFLALDRFERAFAIHPLLAGSQGVLESPTALEEIRKMILGSYADDERFNAFFSGYNKSVYAHEKGILTSYLLGQSTGGKQKSEADVIRDIFEAMPPIGPRVAQEIRSSGRATPAINQTLDRVLDQVLPPTQEQIHADVKKIFGDESHRIRVGKLRGSGSMNYVIDVDILNPETGVWEPRVLKVQRERIGPKAKSEERNWRKAIGEVKEHPNREVRVLASITEDSLNQAVKRLQPGSVELDAQAEMALSPRASRIYDSRRTRAMRADPVAARLIRDEFKSEAGIYERIEGRSLSEITDPAEKRQFAAAILDQELEGIFSRAEFDTDPQPGNWKKENRTGKYVRLDYAQLTRINPESSEQFKTLFGVLIDPRFGPEKHQELARAWSEITSPRIDRQTLERHLLSAINSPEVKGATDPWERMIQIRQELNEKLVAAGKPALEFNSDISNILTSMRKIAGLKEILGEREFFSILNRHVRVPVGTAIRLARQAGLSTGQILKEAVGGCSWRYGKMLERLATQTR